MTAELKGWVCPRCGKVHSPFVSEYNCPSPTIISTTTSVNDAEFRAKMPTEEDKDKYLKMGCIDKERDLWANVNCLNHIDPISCGREFSCGICEKYVPNGAKHLTAQEYIKDNWGENWLSVDWTAGDVVSALEEFGKMQLAGQAKMPSEDVDYTIELLEAEIDSLKDAYKNSPKGIREEYSRRILSHKRVLKALRNRMEESK